MKSTSNQSDCLEQKRPVGVLAWKKVQTETSAPHAKNIFPTNDWDLIVHYILLMSRKYLWWARLVPSISSDCKQAYSKHQFKGWATNIAPRAHFTSYIHKSSVAFRSARQIQLFSARMWVEARCISTAYSIEAEISNTNNFIQRRAIL